MKANLVKFSLLLLPAMAIYSCRKDTETTTEPTTTNNISAVLTATFGTNINLNSLENYSGQTKPGYITKDNSNGNVITNAKATLGRVLFYDKNLSFNNSISCGSCHKQAFAFGDTAQASVGVAGNTTRHAMRLVNARFSAERKFFWDERAASLEAQTTQPVQNHVEMGYSGSNGDQKLSDMLTKLEGKAYYNEIFKFVYGDTKVTEARVQESLSAFIRSIQSFDSKYDVGRAGATDPNGPYSNFTQLENQGKMLFSAPPQFDVNALRTGGGAGCDGCHKAPEFDIDPNSHNNGVIGSITGGASDLIVTRSPTLRDVVKADGTSNGPFMHIGISNQLITVINHYNNISLLGNTDLDARLKPNGIGQKLQLTQGEKDALIAFIKTLGGNKVYTDSKWGNPFKG